MSRYHISPSTGEAKPCSAVVSCPFGSSMPHFNNKNDAQQYFENIMEHSDDFEDKPDDEKKFFNDLVFEASQALVFINDSEMDIVIDGEKYDYIDVASEQNISSGHSQEFADFITTVTNHPNYNEGLDDDEKNIIFQTFTYEPIGNEIKSHSANVFTVDNVDYIFDISYSEVNPNAEYPFVDSLDNWKKNLDKISFMGVEEYIPPPPDPRTFELPKFSLGEYNPLLDQAVLDKPKKKLNGSLDCFLKIDEVKVAVVHYRMADDGPHIMTLETRPEYRNQGYMKKLLKMLAVEHNVDKVHSSGSFTQQGYDYTRHLTNPNEKVIPSVNFPEYNDETPLSYVEDWIEGYTPN